MATRTVKLKIKLGSSVLSNRSIPAGSAPARTEDGPSSSQQTTAALREHAKAVRQALDGYVGPNASPRSIVASLRDCGPSLPLELLPAWDSDSSLALPERPSKRARAELPAAEAAAPASRGDAPECSTQPGSVPADAQVADEAPKKHLQQHPEDPSAEKAVDVCRPDAPANGVHAPGSASSSDHATTSQFQLPSPEDAEHKGQVPSAVLPPPPAAAKPAPAAEPLQGDRRADGAAPGPSSERQQKQHQLKRRQPGCVSVQTGGPAQTLVPPSLFELGSHAAHMLPQPFRTITPFDVQMPPLSIEPDSRVSNRLVTEKTQAAAAKKHRGDAEQRKGGRWTVSSLSQYAEAAMQYMEACEYMLRLPRGPDKLDVATSRERAAKLLSQTCDLLSHAARTVESAHGSELSKEALRILLERLCMVCCMREGALQTQLLAGHAASAKRLQQRQQQHQGSSALQHQPQSAGPSGGQGQRAHAMNASPDDSTTSSQDVLAQQRTGSARPGSSAMPPPQHRPGQQLQLVGLTQELWDNQQRLASAARQVLRFSECARRSTRNFQQYIERPDVQLSQQAKLASMHLAAVGMDMGTSDGFRLLAHAGRALEHIKQL